MHHLFIATITFCISFAALSQPSALDHPESDPEVPLLIEMFAIAATYEM